MIVIKFGRWSEYDAKRFAYTRIHTKNGKWTPFCRMRIRVYADWIVKRLEHDDDISKS